MNISIKADERTTIFKAHLTEKAIIPVKIEGIKDVFYYIAGDEPVMNTAKSSVKLKSLTALIAPHRHLCEKDMA